MFLIYPDQASQSNPPTPASPEKDTDPKNSESTLDTVQLDPYDPRDRRVAVTHPLNPTLTRNYRDDEPDELDTLANQWY